MKCKHPKAYRWLIRDDSEGGAMEQCERCGKTHKFDLDKNKWGKWE